MRLRVKLFATLNRYASSYVGDKLPGTPFEVELPDGATIQQLVEYLKLPEGDVKICFVNGRVQEVAYPLSDSDEVGIFPPVGGGAMAEILIDLWLYGPLARYGGDPSQNIYANCKINLPEGSTVSTLLEAIKMPTEERGITFINGDLSAMPGLQPDLQHELHDNDRVAFFHLRSMWPFQYRHGAAMIDEMRKAIIEDEEVGLHHTYEGEKKI